MKIGQIVRRKNGKKRMMVQKVLLSGLVRCSTCYVKNSTIISTTVYVEKKKLKIIKNRGIVATFHLEI